MGTTQECYLLFWTNPGWLFGFYDISTFLGARGVVVIVTGYGHGDTSSNPGPHIALIPLGKVWIQLVSLQLWVNSRAD